MKNRSSLTIFITILSVIGSFALLPEVKGAPEVAPPPDGCYRGFTTTEGCLALQSLTTGSGNTGVGWRSLFSVGDGSFNTGVGAGALLSNNGDNNTAVGAAALLLNGGGSNNTAVGAAALENANSIGGSNTAVGAFALNKNTELTGSSTPPSACKHSRTQPLTRTQQLVIGRLQNVTTGFFNTAIGAAAGFNQTTGNHNIYIGLGSDGVAGESNTCYIQEIQNGIVSSGANPHFILVDDTGKLGTVAASADGKTMAVPSSLAMLNELQKGQKRVAELETTVAQQAKTVAQQMKAMEILSAQLKEQAAQIQKVSAQLEVNKAAPQTVANN